ncbi:MAG: hypothetical protein HDT42_02710 [Ruminococcaceae bacterium]|nr:hypothetical protein [Oscillospiraceae bacterium]
MAKGRTARREDTTDKKERQSITVLDKSDFLEIRQTQELNEMQQIGIKCGELNEITGNYEMERGDYLYQIIDYNATKKLRMSTQQLCLAIVRELSAREFASRKIVLDIRDYMNLRGLSDSKEARQQMLYDIKVLFNLEVIHGNLHFHMVQNYNDKKRGMIPITIDEDFFTLLKENGYYMSIPPQLFRLSAKKNPNSFHFLYKITAMKRVNLGRKRENTIRMETLLNSSPELPSYEAVMGTDRAISRRIIEPTVRDLNVLSDTLKWSVYDDFGKPVEKSELPKMPYHRFIKLSVHIDWNYYPAFKTFTCESAGNKQSKKRNKRKADRIVA